MAQPVNHQRVTIRSIANPRRVEFEMEGVATIVSVWSDNSVVTTRVSGNLTLPHLMTMLALVVDQVSKHATEALHEKHMTPLDVLDALRLMMDDEARFKALEESGPVGRA